MILPYSSTTFIYNDFCKRKINNELIYERWCNVVLSCADIVNQYCEAFQPSLKGQCENLKILKRFQNYLDSINHSYLDPLNS